MTDLRSELEWLFKEFDTLSGVVENDRGFKGDGLAEDRERAKAIQTRLDWHPIDTAPKDSSAVMLGYFRRNLDGSIYQEGGQPIIARWIERFGGKSGWATTSDNLNSEGSFSPTHWMPLPDPPKD